MLRPMSARCKQLSVSVVAVEASKKHQARDQSST
jgi:hypothetical protein